MKLQKSTFDAMQLPGALALAAAGAATTANGATVQITFSNSFLSTNGGNHLVTDFGGDGADEIVGFLRMYGRGTALLVSGGSLKMAQAGTFMGVGRSAYVFGGVAVMDMALAFQARLVPLMVSDASIHGGAPTVGWLDVVATGRESGEFGRIEVLRFIFDDVAGSPAPTGVSHASGAFTEFGAAVPEPSGLGLLALGAVGVVARRRRAVAA